MATRSTSGSGEEPRSRLTPRPPGTPGDESSGYGDSNPIGHNSDEEVAGASAGASASPEPGDPLFEPREGQDDANAGDAQPTGSAAAGSRGGASGAGNDLSSGPGTLGAASGGERASAGRADANRSSRDHRNTRNR